MTDSRHQKLEDRVCTSCAVEENEFNPEYERKNMYEKIDKGEAEEKDFFNKFRSLTGTSGCYSLQLFEH